MIKIPVVDEAVRDARAEPAIVEEPESEDASAVVVVEMQVPVAEPAVEEGHYSSAAAHQQEKSETKVLVVCV